MRSTSSGSPETWSACTCVSSTATIGIPWPLASGDVVVDQVDVRIDDRELACGSCSRSRYDAQAVSSLSSWRKYIGPPSRVDVGQALDKSIK